MRTLDVFGPGEVFGDANWLRGGDLAYEVNIISACADRVVLNHLGTPVHTDWTHREYRGPIDTLLVAGRMGPRELHYEPGFLDWLRLQSTRARRFGRSVSLWSWRSPAFSTGGARPSLELGERTCTRLPARGRRSRPHLHSRWQLLYHQAGVTAGIDLCLALVEEDLGRPLALRVAQMMVVSLGRPGGQSQFSATLEAQARESRPLGDLLAWLPDNLRRDLW